MLGILALPLVWACASQQAEPTLPDPNVDFGLGDVVLLTWTTRAPEGLLGHALEPGVVAIDPHRRVVDGEPRWVSNDQKLSVVVTAQETAELGAGYGPLGAKAGVGRATHVAYDVRVTGYLELPPDSLHYSSGSACCFNGAPSPSCGEWYVVRLMRGTGKAQYLEQVSAEAGVEAAQLVRARGGTAFRRLNEMSFNDAYFAYEVVPMSSLCSRVSPEQEVETLAVRAPDNCWVQAVRADGSRDAHAWYMPNASLCRQVAQRHCDGTEGAFGCLASFGREGETESMELAPNAAVGVTTAAPQTASHAAAIGGRESANGLSVAPSPQQVSSTASAPASPRPHTASGTSAKSSP